VPRPCACDRFVGPSTKWDRAGGNCRECWLYHTDSRFRALWGPAPADAPLVECPSCPGRVRFRVHPGMDAGDLARLLKGPVPPGGWPPGWAHWPVTRRAFLALFDHAAKNVPPPPDFRPGPGVVICAGGWKFFPGAYVTVRMLRHLGCDWPVQVWYLGDRGEFDPRLDVVTRPHGVEWVNADAFARAHPDGPPRILNGWELKAYAAAWCPFAEVLSLDADCYPVRHPEVLRSHPRHRAAGATFYRDLARLEAGHWAAFGLPHRPGEQAFESGQFLADKGRHWPALWLASWLNSYSDYAYAHVYGDKDTFNVAWRKLGAAADFPTATAPWDQVAFLHKGYDGDTLFVHRARDKMRWVGEVDGFPLDQRYMTHQNYEAPRRFAHFPLEDLAHRFLAESRAEIRHAAAQHRRWVMESTHESWLEAYVPNGGDVALDVGANAGKWTRALAPGFRRVHAVEPNPDALPHLRAALPANATVHEWAAWSSACVRPFRRMREPTHAGAVDFDLHPGHPPAPIEDWPCRPLDDLDPGGRVEFIKVDVEGAEAEVLRGAARLVVRGRPWLLIEVHSPELLWEVQAILAGWRYVPTVIRHPHYEKFSAKWCRHCWVAAQPLLG
jgi:FkbM family methyltransferase